MPVIIQRTTVLYLSERDAAMTKLVQIDEEATLDFVKVSFVKHRTNTKFLIFDFHPPGFQ